MSERAPSSKSIWTTVLASFVVGVLAFVLFVLPAEFGIDPTGFGSVIGVKGMSGYSVQALTTEEVEYNTDYIEFILAPYESIEYKYVLDAGQALLYSWHTQAEVVFDLHSEEEGTDPEDSVSFSVGRAAQESGTYVAPYAGVHGWFWENRGLQEVTIKLQTVGFYKQSTTYGASGEYKRQF